MDALRPECDLSCRVADSDLPMRLSRGTYHDFLMEEGKILRGQGATSMGMPTGRRTWLEKLLRGRGALISERTLTGRCEYLQCLRHQQKPKRLILGSERRRATQSLPFGGERAHSSVIFFHSSIIAQSAREPIAIARNRCGRGGLSRAIVSLAFECTLAKGHVISTCGNSLTCLNGRLKPVKTR